MVLAYFTNQDFSPVRIRDSAAEYLLSHPWAGAVVTILPMAYVSHDLLEGIYPFVQLYIVFRCSTEVAGAGLSVYL